MTPTDHEEAEIDPRPHNLDAERAVLGAMMGSPDAVGTVLGVLSARDFYRPTHGTVFAAITSLFEAGEPTDPVSVAARLQRDGDLMRVGGAPALHTFYASVPTSANVTYHAGLVADAAGRARLVDVSGELAQLAHDSSDLASIQERAREALDAAVKSRDDSADGVWVGDVIDDLMASWEEEEEKGLAFPWADVQEVTNGMKPGQLILFAARPGVGKSTAAMDCARSVAKAGKSALFISLEMTYGELTQRLACAEAKVLLRDVRRRAVGAADKLRLKGAAQDIARMPLRIEDKFAMTLGDIRRVAKETQRSQHGLDLVIVDYIQLLVAADSRASRREQVDSFSRGLKSLAKEFGVPVIAVAQLNRGPEMRNDKKPLMSDLRESGSLEQDADMIFLINRPDANEPVDPRAGEADFILAKHRGGATTTITVAHQLYYCRFEDIARGAR